MVSITVSKAEFVNDFYSYQYTGRRTLRIVKVQEGFTNSHRDIDINGIVMQIEQSYVNSDTVTVIPCPAIIGMSNAYVTIGTDYDYLLGSELTYDNIEKCYLELE